MTVGRRSFIHELYQSYATERANRHERYMRNVRAVCSRSGGYSRYKQDSEKYFRNSWRRNRRCFNRTFLRLYDLWPAGKIYTVADGKITDIRGKNSVP
ncbi:hypothetical protein GC087_05905 [Pantoea sp. JZ2]|nr:hypothetical protein GC087_05905 [Pantoea sp. JZ2]